MLQGVQQLHSCEECDKMRLSLLFKLLAKHFPAGLSRTTAPQEYNFTIASSMIRKPRHVRIILQTPYIIRMLRTGSMYVLT